MNQDEHLKGDIEWLARWGGFGEDFGKARRVQGENVLGGLRKDFGRTCDIGPSEILPKG